MGWRDAWLLGGGNYWGAGALSFAASKRTVANDRRGSGAVGHRQAAPGQKRHRGAVPDSKHLHGLEFERSPSAAASSLKAPYVFNVCLTTDGKACCLEPSHAELHSI